MSQKHPVNNFEWIKDTPQFNETNPCRQKFKLVVQNNPSTKKFISN